MAKSKEETRRISGLPKDTDRVSFSWLTSKDDPHYSLHDDVFYEGSRKDETRQWRLG